MVTVRVEDRDSDLRVVLFDRPTKRNAIDMSVVTGLRDAIVSAPGVAIVVGSTEPTAFSSGADLSLADAERAAVSDALYELYATMRTTPKVIIAAASGYAIGGGAQILIASDLRFAGPDLRIRFVGPGHGLAVGAWGLPSLVGRGRAMDLCLSMRMVTAQEALSMGLVDRIEKDPMAGAEAYAQSLMDLDPGAVMAVKRIVGASIPAESLELEQESNASWTGSMPEGRED